jgi:hypothetical protein
MEPQTLPPAVQDFLDAQHRLFEWAMKQEPPERRLFELALLPRFLHVGHLRDLIREAVREAGPRVECRFSSEDAGMMKLLVAPGQARVGLKYLRDFTKDAKRLTVLDPYLFERAPDEVDAAVEALSMATCLQKEQLKGLHVVHRPLRGVRRGDRAFLHAVKNLCGEHHISFSHCETRVIHDRVWIADGKKAVAVGTSLNGLGTRAAFILELPDDDLRELQGFLRERGLAP